MTIAAAYRKAWREAKDEAARIGVLESLNSEPADVCEEGKAGPGMRMIMQMSDGSVLDATEMFRHSEAYDFEACRRGGFAEVYRALPKKS